MKMKKIIAVAIAGIFLIGFFVVDKPVIAASLEEIQNQLQSLLNQVNRLQLEVDNRQKVSAEAILPAFNITIRWGNVIGKAVVIKATKFNGSVEIKGSGNINVSSSSFESSDNDRIISRTSPAKVLWRSTIGPSWDGVKVRINNALPTDTIIIGTTQGTTTKTVQEFYDLTAPFIQDVGEGREIVVDGTPKSQSSSSSFVSSQAISSSSSSLTDLSSSSSSAMSSSSSSVSNSFSSSSQRTEVNINFSKTCKSVSFVINNESGHRADNLTFKKDGENRIIKITGAVAYDKTGNSYNVDIDVKWGAFCMSKITGKAYLISSTPASSSSSSSLTSSSFSSSSEVSSVGSSSSSGQSSQSSSNSSSSSTSSADSSNNSSSSRSSLSSSSNSSVHHIPRLHFNMTVRWGNVIGKATAEGKKAASFNGSVEILGATTAGKKITLVRKRKFEGRKDRIISRTVNKVVWKSTTYGGWDGVVVRISTSPDDTVVIGTAQGTTTMTAQELYNLTLPSIQSAGEGREIVIDGTPNIKLLNFNMTVRWGNVIGKATAEGKTQTDFSGSIEIPNITISDIRKTEVQLINGLRFEKGKSQHDNVSEADNKITWKSTIYGDWDGVKIRMRNVFPTDEVVIGTAQGATTMTTQELYDLTSPFIQDVSNGREIIINGTPKTRSDRFLSSDSSSSSSSSLPASSSSAGSQSSSSSVNSSSVSSSSSASVSSSSSVSSASSSSVSNSSSTSSAQ